MNRAASTVVGVALLVGVTVVALGALTAGVGTVVESQADRADARAVADALTSIDAAGAGGVDTVPLAFSEGRLATADRDLRVLVDGTVVAREQVDALAYRSGRQRTVSLAGAVVRASGGSAWFVRDPPVTATDSGNGTVLVVAATVLEGPVTATGPTDARLRTEVRRSRRAFPGGSVAVAVETTTPRPWVDYLTEQGARVGQRDLDGDGTASVVATFDRVAETHLVVDRVEVALDG